MRSHVAGRQEDRADDDGEPDHRLGDVLSLDAPELRRFAREVGAGGVELLADQRVVAGADEEGELRDLGGARDLDRAAASAPSRPAAGTRRRRSR